MVGVDGLRFGYGLFAAHTDGLAVDGHYGMVLARLLCPLDGCHYLAGELGPLHAAVEPHGGAHKNAEEYGCYAQHALDAVHFGLWFLCRGLRALPVAFRWL